MDSLLLKNTPFSLISKFLINFILQIFLKNNCLNACIYGKFFVILFSQKEY